MPSVIEVEETFSEIQKLPIYEKPQQAIVTSPGFVSRVIAAFRGMLQTEYTEELRQRQYAWERPIDTLARTNPYLYTETLFC
jgi:hypothetical protein